MNTRMIVFITLNTLVFSDVTANYLNSETKLLKILDEYIKTRENYINKARSYLDALQEAHIRTNYPGDASNKDATEATLKNCLIYKRFLVDWANFANYLFNDTQLKGMVVDSVHRDADCNYSDWIFENNDVKLISFVRSLVSISEMFNNKKMPVNDLFKQNHFHFPLKNGNKFYSLDFNGKSSDIQPDLNNVTFKKWHNELKERIIVKINKFKNLLGDFIKATEYVAPLFYTYWSTYTALCRGEVIYNKESSNMKCRYAHYNKPYLLIGPLKLEELFPDPQILMYHDILSDNEINYIKKTGIKNKMSISQSKETSYRVAKVAWLTHKELPKLSLRLEYMTNLNLESAEALQVAVYGSGGQYEPHYDSGTDEADPTSTRISTVLFYLNDVKKGGATVFPELKLAVWPKKGSAVFWYNIKPSYKVETRNLHAGCPIYLGTKWVMNLWVKYHSQEFNKPCKVKHPNSFMF